MQKTIAELNRRRVMALGMKLLTLFVVATLAFLIYRGLTVPALIDAGVALMCLTMGYLPERKAYRSMWQEAYASSAYAQYIDKPTLERKAVFTPEAFRALALLPCLEQERGYLFRNHVSGTDAKLSLMDAVCPVAGAQGKNRFICGCLIRISLSMPAAYRARCAGSAVMPQDVLQGYCKDTLSLKGVAHEASGMPAGTALYTLSAPLPDAIAQPLAALCEKCGGNAIAALEEDALYVFIQHRLAVRALPDGKITQATLNAPSVPELPDVIAVADAIRFIDD